MTELIKYVQDGIAWYNYLEVEFEGIRFYISEHDLHFVFKEQLTVIRPLTNDSDCKPVYRPLSVRVPGLGLKFNGEINCYVTERLDAARLASVLHRLVRENDVTVQIEARARFLASWRNGVRVGTPRTLDDYYLDITPEERAETALF